MPVMMVTMVPRNTVVNFDLIKHIYLMAYVTVIEMEIIKKRVDNMMMKRTIMKMDDNDMKTLKTRLFIFHLYQTYPD